MNSTERLIEGEEVQIGGTIWTWHDHDLGGGWFPMASYNRAIDHHGDSGMVDLTCVRVQQIQLGSTAKGVIPSQFLVEDGLNKLRETVEDKSQPIAERKRAQYILDEVEKAKQNRGCRFF